MPDKRYVSVKAADHDDEAAALEAERNKDRSQLENLNFALKRSQGRYDEDVVNSYSSLNTIDDESPIVAEALKRIRDSLSTTVYDDEYSVVISDVQAAINSI